MQANLRHSTVNIICTTLEPIAICPITIRPSLRPFLRESDLGGGLRQIFASLGRVYGLVSSSRIYLVDRFALMQSIRSSAGGQRLHNDLSSFIHSFNHLVSPKCSRFGLRPAVSVFTTISVLSVKIGVGIFVIPDLSSEKRRKETSSTSLIRREAKPI